MSVGLIKATPHDIRKRAKKNHVSEDGNDKSKKAANPSTIPCKAIFFSPILPTNLRTKNPCAKIRVNPIKRNILVISLGSYEYLSTAKKVRVNSIPLKEIM